jgi:hypothetical protein
MRSTLEMQVRAINGAGPGKATAEIIARSMGDRLRGSAAILGLGLVVGLLFLPVPLLHIFGLIAFLGCAGLAVKRFRVRALVHRVAGLCPSCRQESGFFVGGGHWAARWPLTSQCGSCGIQVRLIPASSTVTGAGVVE